MNREDKLLKEITEKKLEISMLEKNLMTLRYLDWKEMEGKYYLVECFPCSDGVTFRVYHILKITKDSIKYNYGDKKNKYTSTLNIDNLYKRGYKKWTEITKKEYNKHIKGFENIDGDAEVLKDVGGSK